MRRDLTLYWWGQTASAFGSVFSAVALPVIAVVHLRASPAQVGLISAAATLPVLFLGLPAGVLADRITRPRRTLMLLDLVSALTVGLVALGVAGRAATVGWLVALGLVQGAAAIVAEVVYFVHLRQVAGANGIGRARARLQAGEYGAGFVGRLLAGPTILVLGGAAALGVDAVSYVLSATALLGMRPVAPLLRGPAQSVGSMLRGAVEGIRFFTDDGFHRALLVFLVAPAGATAGTGALTSVFLLRVVHVPTTVYGAVFALSGLVGLAGSAAAGRLLTPARDPRVLCLAAFTAAGVCALLLPAAVGPLPVALSCAAAAIGLQVFFGAVANVALGPVVVTGAAEEALGRAIATLQVVAAGAGVLGALAGGFLGSWIGTRNALWVLDAGALGAELLVLPFAARGLRSQVERPPQTSSAAPKGVVRGRPSA